MERRYIGFEETILTKRKEYLERGNHYYMEYLHSQNQELLEMALKCWGKNDELWERLCKYWEREGKNSKQKFLEKIFEIEA